ncbi:MAG: monofunctional biosynthetic peptidoglycan transglycosylase [Candidatus Kapaibacterium sp.]|nr:MAG: monofunctional biosynthetic peptidoglycan transglycosylase [Candidatus Kapabacteria bacterium]
MVRRIALWFIRFILAWLIGSCALVLVYALVRPPVTPVMLINLIADIADGGQWHGIEKRWVDLEAISPSLVRAVIAAEDTRFFEHHGFDWEAIEQARQLNERYRGRRLYGASTISMQTAKNVFLWHGRNYLRKALEAYFTVLIEAVWGKRRIMEVYLNVVEFAPGVYGAEAAANRYWRKPASRITSAEAALMAAVLPNPRRWKFWQPTPYIRKRQATILARMNDVRLPGDWYVSPRR